MLSTHVFTHSHSIFHRRDVLLRNELSVKERLNEFDEIARRRNDRSRAARNAQIHFFVLFPGSGVTVGKAFLFADVGLSRAGIGILQPELSGDPFL